MPVFLAASGILQAQTQANPFLDDSTVQIINLTMDPNDWASLQQHYLENTYYHATFAWNGISMDIGVRSHGGGSRSPIKPNLDLNIDKYVKKQTFLGLPFLLIKANNQDASNLREWISMKLFRKMGIPAPREAPAQVYLNGQVLGFYYIVEHEDETFLDRNFGESGGYLYQWESFANYDFENLGTDPSLYATFLDLKTDQDTPDLQTFTNLVQAINQPASSTFNNDAFIAALARYLDPKQFLTYGATEQVLAGSDSLIGGQQGMNNFYLYQFQGTTRYYFVPWDKDFTLSDAARDIMDGISTGPNINRLAQRLVAIPQYQQVYLEAVAKAAALMGGAGGWADQEISREYAVIHAAATNDPNKQCTNLGVLYSCGAAEFEDAVQVMRNFLAARPSFVQSEIAAARYQPSTGGPQIAEGGVSSWGGVQALSPGGLATVSGSSLAAAVHASGTPLPRILGNTIVTVEGVRAPLLATASGGIDFQVPGDIPAGDASVVVSTNGDMSNTVDIGVLDATPSILAVVHQNGTALAAGDPLVAGEVLSLYATGLGAVNGNLAIGAASASKPVVTTVASPQVLLGDLPMTATFSGLAPGFVGLYQVNAVVPSGTMQDSFPAGLTLTVNGQTAGWTFPVSQASIEH
jgi:uncharacterized protein (TIGR03437 family)